MKRKILFSLALLLVSIIIVPFLYIQFQIKSLEDDVMNYLIKEKGYSKSDIKSINGRFGKLLNFLVYVVFEDEPLIMYSYLRDGTQIKQFHYTITEEAQEQGISYDEISETELKHLEK
jgi:hypothetical protein